MPIYAYRCERCGHAKDVLQKVSDPVLTVCPACGESTFRKQVTAAGFQLKGSGWYVTDFRGDKPSGKSAEAGADGDAKPADSKNADSKGGDAKGGQVEDVLTHPDGTVTRWAAARIRTRHDHGTGCTLSSAIAAHLAMGEPLELAVASARAFVRGAMAAGATVHTGAGHGPLNHGFAPRPMRIQAA